MDFNFHSTSHASSEENNMIKKPELIIDIGMKFATEKSKRKTHYGRYICKCGVIFDAIIHDVNSGKTKSCGCHNMDSLIKRNIKHGKRYTRLYSKWLSIKNRCNIQSNKSFMYYGGIGIKICDEWSNDFMSFYNWAISNGYIDGLEIDRINNDGNYDPSNCRFVNNCTNKQNTKLIKSTNKSGYRGVCFKNRDRKYIASISVNGEKKYIGSFNDPIAAAIAYDTFVIVYGLNHTQNFNGDKK